MAHSRLCSIPGCGKPHLARGLCNKHYLSWKRYGDAAKAKSYAERGSLEPFLQTIVSNHPLDDCVIWPFGMPTEGYPTITKGDKSYYVHRLVCEMTHGPAPSSEYQAAHSCGKGHLGCVNPAHLSWKTQIENEDDKRRHGTLLLGSKANGAKLKEADVLAIRRCYPQEKVSKLAAHFRVSESLIYLIIKRKRWEWLPD